MMELAGEIFYALKAKDAQLVQQGIAEVTTGGIRNVETKELMALARPVPIEEIKNKNAFQMADRGSVADASSALQWVNMALQLANLAVTIGGFYLTLTKMESLHGDIRRFIDRYHADQNAEQFEKYKFHLKNLTSQINFLQCRYGHKEYDDRFFIIRESDIETECNETASFLERILDQYQRRDLETELACNILFTLAPVYTQLINEFCYQYRVVHDMEHQQMETWKNVLKKINSDEFASFLKREMIFNIFYAHISPIKRFSSLTVVFDCMRLLLDNIDESAKAAESAPKDRLVPVAELISKKAWNDVKDKIVTAPNETAEEYVKRKIMAIEIPEDGEEEVYIPIQVSYAR